MTATMIRAARPDEATLLSELALRAKGHWGYDATFLEACRADLTVAPEEIAAGTIVVAARHDDLRGFYQLLVTGEVAELDDLWVEPSAIGEGIGKALWQHAVATARARGCRELRVQSDPHAEGFYRRMGATRIGTKGSSVIPGRALPLLRLALG